MTKELVKREKGHKIIKHAGHDRTHSLSFGSRIKMRLTTPCLVILFLAVASGESADQQPISRVKAERTTENSLQKTTVFTDKTVSANAVPDSFQLERNDENVITPDNDMTLEEMLLFESLINDDDKIIENKQNSDANMGNNNGKSDDIDSNAENPVESKISTDLIDIRRQGDINPEVQKDKSHATTKFDDSKQKVANDPPPRFGQRSRKAKQKVQDDEAPVLQLTQGGYNRPYMRPRFRNRYTSRPESSEQSENIQNPERNSNDRQPDTRRVVPQVTYSPLPQSPYAYGPDPLYNRGLNMPARNLMAINHIVPTAPQEGFLNSPGFADYTATPFQAQFPQRNDVSSFPNFMRDPNSRAIYQSSRSDPFQTPGILFQTAPQAQAQSAFIDSSRNVPPQFQPNPFTAYPGFESVEDVSRPNNVQYFSNPRINNQFQVPSDFYSDAPNRINTFNNPPITFLSNYPNSDDRLTSQFLRYPAAPDAQNNQRNTNNQQLDSDASEEAKKAKIEVQETGNPVNRGDVSSVPFGTRLQAQNDADVYMRYPTNEAGYAIEENLPPQNNSDVPKDNSQQVSSEQKFFPNVSLYRNVLNSGRNNQGINNSFDFPPELFRDVPIDFGYQRPQNEIFAQYPDRNRGMSRYPSPNFETRNPRNPFDPIIPLPENNYQFFNADNQRRRLQESDGVPNCAKQNNASVCFEDNEYPGNDILYTLNTNSFLSDRLMGPELPLNSIDLVERNVSESDQSSENYACAVATKYGAPLRAKNLSGMWRIIVNLQGKFLQPVRMEVCKSFGDPCNYAESRVKTTCVQKYSLQRLLTWSPGRGVYSDVYKFPVACSCQIIEITQP